MLGVRWLVAAAVVLAAGCRHADTVTGRCNVATDCTAGLTCDNSKTCVPTTASSSPCSSTSQCGAGYACDNLGWCVCQNQGMSPDLCGSASLPNYRGVESDGGLPDGSGGSTGSGGAGGKDAGRDVGVDSGFVCHANQDCPTGKGICADGGVCVGCTADSDCAKSTSPICNLSTNTCVACTTDAQCVAKFGATGTSGPGVCMFQDDGHCATDSETVYVQPTKPTGCVGTTMAGAGSAGMPFCSLSNAIASAGTRILVVLRGGSIAAGVTISASAPISIVGQMSATITAAAAQGGLSISGTAIYLRDFKIVGTDPTATIGVIADSNAILRLDGVDIENMPEGGLRVTGGTSYDIVNSIFAKNGGVLDDAGRSIGGAFLSNPTPGQSSRFAFNTVVGNQSTGVLCSSSSQTIDASLLAQNLGSGTVPDYSGCTLSTSMALAMGNPLLTSTYRATANSPCVDAVATPPAGAPDHDIDSVSRPQGKAYDCGASEYKSP